MMNGTTTTLHHFAHYPPPVHPLRSPTSATLFKATPSAVAQHSSPVLSAAAVQSAHKVVDRQSNNHHGVSSLHPLRQKHKKRFGGGANGGSIRPNDSLKVSTEDSPLVDEEDREAFTQFSASPVYFPIELGSSFTASTLHASDPTSFPTAESAMVSPAATAASRHLESFSSFMSTSSTMSSSTTPSHSSSASLSDFAAAFQTPSPSKSRHSAPILNLPRAVPLHDFDLASPGKNNNKQSYRGKRAVKDEKASGERGSLSSSSSSTISMPKGSPPALLSVLIQQHRDSLGSLAESDRLSSSSSLVSGFVSPTLPNPSSCSPADEDSVRRVEEEENELANAVHEERLREGKLTLEADEDKVDRRLFHTPRVPQEEVDENIYDSEEEDETGGHSDGDLDDVSANVPTAANENEGPSTPARMIRAASCHSTPPKSDLSSSSAFFPVTDHQRRSMPVLMSCARCNRFQAGGGVKVNSADLFACKCTEREQEELCAVVRRRGNSHRKLSRSSGEESEFTMSDANANGCKQLQSVSSNDSVARSLSHLAIRPPRTVSATSASSLPQAAPKRSGRGYLPPFVESTEDDGIMVDSSVMQFELDL